MQKFRLSQTDKTRSAISKQAGLAINKLVTTALFTVVCFLASKPAFAGVVVTFD